MATKLYVGNLAYTTTEDELREKFSQFGEVESVNVIMDRDTGRSKGFGFVEMGTEDAAKAAIEAMNGQEIDGRTIKVSESKPQERRPGGGGGRGGGRGGFGGGGGGRGGFGGGGGGGRGRY
ncbi:MAG: RNA recognition motif domain-containing protein [Candidatus Aquicultor sp.]